MSAIDSHLGHGQEKWQTGTLRQPEGRVADRHTKVTKRGGRRKSSKQVYFGGHIERERMKSEKKKKKLKN